MMQQESLSNSNPDLSETIFVLKKKKVVRHMIRKDFLQLESHHFLSAVTDSFLL